MPWKSQRRDHGGHSHAHSHSHKHDNTYLTSKNKKDAGVRITRIGLYVNVFMAFGKATGGYFLNSQSLLADAAHSFTDLVSDILTLGTVAFALRPPTERFPSGYGKVESLGSLGVSTLLLAGGMGLGWHSVEMLYSMLSPAIETIGSAAEHAGHAHEHGHSHGGGSIFGHSHSHNPADMGIPNIHAAWIAGGSILVKEYLYRATIKIARERKSSVLASNAVHHRIDSLTSIVALTAILASNILSSVAWLDPVGGLLVSLMVIKAGWTNVGNAVRELADINIDADTRNSVSGAARKALSSESSTSGLQLENIEVREVSGIKAGQNYLVELKLGVPETMTVKDTRPVEDLVRRGIGAKVRGIRRVKVKFEANTEASSNPMNELISTDLSPKSSPEPEEHDHDHSHGHVNDHANGQVHSQGTGEPELTKRR
ncbi:uncharacterized protein KY384_008289 [Bacidia gigantensis]|uniref:uncharacterized protein n=1 Tax=Bacidia gigantensis TaxID=2732470 RepID=UPI001D0516FF|nr:uncharacterized protein KY384_008289 [Bacidia gigantensis]KAG8526860.1 hypothetical protein KY384_008289 [Bacidia gigantensis]